MEWNGLIQAKIASIVDLSIVPNNNNRKNNFQIFPTKSKVSNGTNINIQLVKSTYKDLKKRVSLELSQQSIFFEKLHNIQIFRITVPCNFPFGSNMFTKNDDPAFFP